MIHYYCYHNQKKIIVSDLPVEKVRLKFGHQYEILTSIKTRESVPVTSERILRSYPSFIIVEKYQKAKFTLTEEQRRKISLSKLGKPRTPEARAKISAGRKGKSNFEGKRHTPETRALMAQKKMGNNHVKNYYWAHDPRSEKEVRVKDLKDIPKGFSKGRDYYSVEPGLYYFNPKVRAQESTNSPKEKQSNEDPLIY